MKKNKSINCPIFKPTAPKKEQAVKEWLTQLESEIEAYFKNTESQKCYNELKKYHKKLKASYNEEIYKGKVKEEIDTQYNKISNKKRLKKCADANEGLPSCISSNCWSKNSRGCQTGISLSCEYGKSDKCSIGTKFQLATFDAFKNTCANEDANDTGGDCAGYFAQDNPVGYCKEAAGVQTFDCDPSDASTICAQNKRRRFIGYTPGEKGKFWGSGSCPDAGSDGKTVWPNIGWASVSTKSNLIPETLQCCGACLQVTYNNRSVYLTLTDKNDASAHDLDMNLAAFNYLTRGDSSVERDGDHELLRNGVAKVVDPSNCMFSCGARCASDDHYKCQSQDVLRP